MIIMTMRRMKRRVEGRKIMDGMDLQGCLVLMAVLPASIIPRVSSPMTSV
jgi:hypothetical protein